MPFSLSRRAFLATAFAALSGCGKSSAGPAKVPRIVSLSPSTTEAVFSIGAGKWLVGRSRFCDYPEEALALPAVGGFSDPSIEAIVGLRPTLVVGARGPAGPSLADALGAQGIPTYFPETESFAQIGEMLVGLGDRVHLREEASAVAKRIALAKEEVAKQAASLPAPRVVMLFDTGPIVVAGPGGFPDELLRLARAENLITEGGPYPTIGLERLIALDPDVLLDGASAGAPGGPQLLAKREAPGWKTLRAFTNGRISAVSSVVLRPGPRIGDGLRELARAVHGSAILLP